MSRHETSDARSGAGPAPERERVRVRLVGGGPDAFERVRALLASSVTTHFEVRHEPVVHGLDLATLAERADVALLHAPAFAREAVPNRYALHDGEAGAATPLPLPLVVLGDADDERATLAWLRAGASSVLPANEGGASQLVTAVLAGLQSHRTLCSLDEAREHAVHLATHDPATDLENRLSFHARLGQSLAIARRKGRRLAVLFVDVEGLKKVNEGLGHRVGDRLVRAVAERLAGSVRLGDSVASRGAGGDGASDAATAVSHLGANEFTVLLAEISQAQDASIVARRILRLLAQPFRVDGHEVFARTSVGVAVFPTDGEDPEKLLRSATAAAFQAKAAGRNEFRFYARSMNSEASRRLDLSGRLHHALARDELSLHYQPLRHATSGRLLGAEALLRWTTPGLGSISPGEFVPIAEETGLIVPIGAWVLQTAAAQCRRWQDDGFAPFRLAVNVSARQLEEPELVSTVAESLESAGLSPDRLELEITETTLMRDDAETASAFRELRDLGVRLALDDFGTGYSALTHLRQLPVDRLKIDRSFVGEIAHDSGDATLAAALIAMAHSLDLAVVAEGVETIDQAEFLRRRGCDELQGFLLGRPVPPDQFERFLERTKEV